MRGSSQILSFSNPYGLLGNCTILLTTCSQSTLSISLKIDSLLTGSYGHFGSWTRTLTMQRSDANHYTKCPVMFRRWIHPQIPLRKPCYALTLLSTTWLTHMLSHVGLPSKESVRLAGGVCKRQGHIQRQILIDAYYGIQIHEDELQSSILTRISFTEIASSFRNRIFLY